MSEIQNKINTLIENREKAREFLKQVQRGDYFQMAADYYYGVGAHSMLFIADYDPETDSDLVVTPDPEGFYNPEVFEGMDGVYVLCLCFLSEENPPLAQ